MAGVPRAPGRLQGFAIELTVLALAGSVYLLLVTYGSLELFAEERLSKVYDYLGNSFLLGEATVPTSSESFRVDGRDYVYFGPLPALLRIPLNALWPGAFGEWSRIATLAAGMVALVAWMRLVRAVAPTAGRGERALLYLAFALGTPVVFLLSCPYVFHETLAIALAASLCGISVLVPALLGRPISRWTWPLYGSFVAAAYLTRLTFAVPHLLVVLALLSNAALGPAAARRLPVLRPLYRARLAASLRRPSALAGLLVPLAISFAFQAWYNVERFGGVFTYTDISKYLAYQVDPDLLAHVEQIGGFNARRVPTNFANYFGTLGRIGRPAPFVHFELNQGLSDALYIPGYREWNISLWLVSGWLLVGAGLGAGALIRRRLLFEALVALAFAGQLVVILTYYWISHRYVTEVLPLLAVLFAFALAHRPAVSARLPATWRWLAAALLAASIPATLASSLSWNAEFNWGVPDDYRRALHRSFDSQPHFTAPLAPEGAPDR
ncbi:MAG: hypothetical protein VX466_08100 [Myxococcota bacterium]|nr:hypothetical protein [Myxococcota bacterium]MEE2673740.1 hypothetical protein [Myxococcota bacterium]